MRASSPYNCESPFILPIGLHRILGLTFNPKITSDELQTPYYMVLQLPFLSAKP